MLITIELKAAKCPLAYENNLASNGLSGHLTSLNAKTKYANFTAVRKI